MTRCISRQSQTNELYPSISDGSAKANWTSDLDLVVQCMRPKLHLAHLLDSADAEQLMELTSAFPESRPKEHAFQIALLISVVLHGVVLLWVRLDSSDLPAPVTPRMVEVTLITSPPEEKSEPEPAELVVASEVLQIPEEVRMPIENSPSPLVTEPASAEPTESPDRADWENIAATQAESIIARDFAEELNREVMWRKTFSVMFEAPENWLIEEEPFLPGLQFESDKPRRLGIKISENCFLGFPGIDPQTIDSDAPGWSGGGAPQPSVKLISCGF